MNTLNEDSFYPPFKSISQKLRCQICKNYAIEPCISQCQHLFCKKCLKSFKENKFICPSDKEIINKMKLREYDSSYYFDNIICKCGLSGLGCTWCGKISDYEYHYLSH